MCEMKKYYRVKEERNIHRTVKRRKANWVGHTCCRNCLLKDVIEGSVKVMIYDGKTKKKK